MKKIVVAVLIIAILILIYSAYEKSQRPAPILSYDFNFEEPLDREFWMIAGWESVRHSNELLVQAGGILKLSMDDTGVMPYMLSKPIEIRQGDVVTMRRKVRIKHGNDTFSGGVAMYQTSDVALEPEPTSGSWQTSFGDGVFLVEYAYDLIYEQERPGRDVFRFLAADWAYNDNYVLVPSVYDQWVEEVFTYDTRNNQISYTIDDDTYKLSSYKLDLGNVRFMMHPFGTGRGNSVEIKEITITVENKNIR
ncbi:hypothetical protein [Fusibacter tunisiensis]|uniref:Uncharacterized protein n=1 Tax=Fusibacter tunisiensis TaxID=1008308 RepID=A0ABS2MS68_9FIRM|nr:hypothetical protein [Fusibacter tunisiensis]MBM7562197.1 hypothetical protein [Fusibacter tunisiensis]